MLRCSISNNSSQVAVIPCIDVGSDNIVYMGYSIRTRSYRYTQWREWIAAAQLADWSNAGLVGVELYDHRLNLADSDPAMFENDNLAGISRFGMIEATLRNQLESTVKSSFYSNRRCGLNPIQLPQDVRCRSAGTAEACANLFATRCAWFLGYGCQESTFCEFKTKDRVRANKKTGKTQFKLPEGAPGCSLFSSRCLWRKGRCEKRTTSTVE